MNATIRKMLAGLGVMAVLVTGMAERASAHGQVDRVEAFATDNWSGYAGRGDLVRVVVNGDGDTDLDLYVFQDGQLLAYDADPTDYCVVVFRAPRSGRFQIQVVNRGSVWNEYELDID